MRSRGRRFRSPVEVEGEAAADGKLDLSAHFAERVCRGEEVDESASAQQRIDDGGRKRRALQRAMHASRDDGGRQIRRQGTRFAGAPRTYIGTSNGSRESARQRIDMQGVERRIEAEE